MDKKTGCKLGGTVWHYYTGNGRLVRRRLQPGQLPPEGSGWIRGFGPHNPETRAKLAARTREVHCGKIVSEHTRALMSQASRGRPKSPEHRAAMRQAALRRAQRERLAKLGITLPADSDE